MDYRKFGDTYYIRMDRDDEIISCLISVCRENKIDSATFSGIGGCKEAEIQIFNPETKSFDTNLLNGVLELVSVNGNIIKDDSGEYFHHTHAAFSFNKDGTHTMQGGHMKSTTVLYTAEIELRPVIGGRIGRKPDPETGTGFWDFSNKHDSVV